jgi:myo-inositol-1(or 4)-monophosphatase
MISVKLPIQSSILAIMAKAVVKASKLLLRDFNELENLQVSVKNNKDFVTNADLKSDQILKDELSRARPTYSIISEETPEITGTDSDYRWIIDPLDGTINYMHGFPHWAISIALEKNDEIVAAVTYDPVKNEMFWAEKGSGAYLNDKKIRVSGKNVLSNLLISVDVLLDDRTSKSCLLFSNTRKTGSTTLNMAYLAAGRIDVVFSSPKPNKWDMAAGMLLIQEAGGVLATKNGHFTADYRQIAVTTNIKLLSLLEKQQILERKHI